MFSCYWLQGGSGCQFCVILVVLLVLHKTDIPIRPIINNMKALSHELAKHLAKILNQYITLNNYYNVINSTSLAIDLTKLKIHDKHKLITFDVKGLYVNIPIDETLAIIKSKLLENNDTQITQQLLTLLKVILSQNYFTFQPTRTRCFHGVFHLNHNNRNISSTLRRYTLKTVPWYKEHTAIHTIRIWHPNLIRHNKNSPTRHQFIHKPNTL